MSTSGIVLLAAFLLAVAAYFATMTIGFVAPVILIDLSGIAAVVGIVLDVRSRRGRV